MSRVAKGLEVPFGSTKGLSSVFSVVPRVISRYRLVSITCGLS